jgi:hypothetical protein
MRKWCEGTCDTFATAGATLTLYNSGFFEFGPMIPYSWYPDHDLEVENVDYAGVTGLSDINLGVSFAVNCNF